MLKHIQQRLAPWLQRISRPRRIYSAGRWAVHATGSLFAEQIIGRDHCQYLCLDLSHLPASKRNDALKYQVVSHSPWSEPGYQVAWHQGYAQLWLWPSVDTPEPAHAQHAEPVFWQPPARDGLYLYVCTQGYDLQHWQQGRLQASQWYANVPDQAQQHWFCRSQGLPASAVLAPQQPVILAQPWQGLRLNPLQGIVRQPGSILRWAGFALVLVASLELAGLAQWHLQANRYSQQRQQLEQELGEVLEQRSRAREALAGYDELYPLLDQPDPLSIQQLITGRLGSVADYSVLSWSRQGLEVDLTIETDSDSALALVNALRGPGVRDAQAQPGQRANQYRLSIQLQVPLPDLQEVEHEG